MSDINFIVSTLVSAYASGWAWGKAMLAFKQFMDKTV